MVTVFLDGSGATGLDPIQESMVRWANEQLDLRRKVYDRARKYYKGEHDVKLTDRLKRFLQEQGLEFSDNFCDVVVDALAERLSVIGFSGSDEKLNDWVWQTWQANRMDGKQITAHTEAVMMGDAYILADWDDTNSRPRFTSQMPEMIIPHYDETTGEVNWFSKKWTTGEVGETPMTRLSLYFPERVEKYKSEGNRWVRHMDEGDLQWPMAWIDNDGEPIGITLAHFRNKLLSENYGDSEISDIIPMQDLLNKSLIDLVMMEDNMAFGQRWTLNIVHSSDHLNISPGSVAEFHGVTDGPDPEIGEWTAGNPEGILKSIDTVVQHIAATSRTPQHMFRMSGDFPSGESLKVSESGLVKKAKRRQINFGNTWENLMRMAVRLESAFGNQTVGEAMVETVWEDPESRNEESHLNSLKAKMELGIPQRQLWREMGYNEDDIDQMEDDIVQERSRSSNIGSEILRQFEGGQGAF